MQPMPKHVAIIMDGNGRWAKSRRMPRFMGHKSGSKAVKKAIEFCVKHKIPVLSLFALSIENRQNRPKKELEYLLSLFLESLRKHTAELHKNNIRIQVVGDRTKLSDILLSHVSHAENLTADNTGLQFILAIDYSGRWDILQATQKIIAAGVDPESLTEAEFSRYLAFSSVTDPDLLIRTSGEQRISNFMLWQCAYTEFYFSQKHWPDFDEASFLEAINAYKSRERRYGYTSDQINDKVMTS